MSSPYLVGHARRLTCLLARSTTMATSTKTLASIMFPERAEDKKVSFGYLGWEAGRHPCLGMRFANLETNVIIAHFLATFDEYHLCDASGEAVPGLPQPDFEAHATSKPAQPVYLKVHWKEDQVATLMAVPVLQGPY